MIACPYCGGEKARRRTYCSDACRILARREMYEDRTAEAEKLRSTNGLSWIAVCSDLDIGAHGMGVGYKRLGRPIPDSVQEILAGHTNRGRVDA